MNLFELFVKIGVDDQASEAIEQIAGSLGNGLKVAAEVALAAVGAVSAGIAALTTMAIKNFAEYEQLAGGAEKIFDEISMDAILEDAQNAYKELGLSANQYLAIINDVGAMFSATMGDEKGYETAQIGLQAISDYASGTGKNVDILSDKFVMITRSAASYQSIADQFSGILPATSAAFLEQAQAAGFLSEQYKSLTEVPIDEYQEAVSLMLQQGVRDLGLAGNTAAEAMSTISGSLAMTKAAWSNLVTGIANDVANLDVLIDNFVSSVRSVVDNIMPKISTALQGTSKLLTEIVPILVTEIPRIIEENLPLLAESAMSIINTLVSGIRNNQSSLIKTAIDVISFLVKELISLLPDLFDVGIGIVTSLEEGLASVLPDLISSAVDSIIGIAEALTDPENLLGVLNAGVAIINAVATGILQAVPKLISVFPTVINNIVKYYVDSIPVFVKLGSDLLTALFSNLGPVLDAISEAAPLIIESVVATIAEGVPAVVDAGVQLLLSLIDQLPYVISTIASSSQSITLAIVEAIVNSAPLLIEAGIKLFISLIAALPVIIAEIIAAVPQIISALQQAFSEVSLAEVGRALMNSLWEGMKSAFAGILEWANSAIAMLNSYVNFRFGFSVGGGGGSFASSLPRISGSHAGGLDYVPFDGYVAQLHKGERVISASEAKESAGNTFGDIYINIDGAQYQDENMLAMAVAEAIQNMTDRRSAVYA